MRQLESLVENVGRLTGVPGVTYTVSVEPVIHVTGSVAGNPVNVSLSPTMNFNLGQQLTCQRDAAATPNPPVRGSRARRRRHCLLLPAQARRAVRGDRADPVSAWAHDRPDRGRRRPRVAGGGRSDDQGAGQARGFRPATNCCTAAPAASTPIWSTTRASFTATRCDRRRSFGASGLTPALR